MIELKEVQRQLSLDESEYGLVVIALNEKRNEMIEEKHSTDFVDSVLLKVFDAPKKKVKVHYDEER